MYVGVVDFINPYPDTFKLSFLFILTPLVVTANEHVGAVVSILATSLIVVVFPFASFTIHSPFLQPSPPPDAL